MIGAGKTDEPTVAMKEPDLEEEALQGKQVGKNLVVERRTMADTAAPVTATSTARMMASVRRRTIGSMRLNRFTPAP